MRIGAAVLALVLPTTAVASERIVFAITNSNFSDEAAPFGSDELSGVLPGARDVTTQFEAVQGRGAAAFLLGGLSNIRRPDDWPAERAKDWDDGVAGCRAEGAGNKRDEARCASRLASILWQRFLDSTGADRFVLVLWRRASTVTDYELEATTYAILEGPEVRAPRRHADAAGAPKVVRAIVKEVLSGIGSKEIRAIGRELPGTAPTAPADAKSFDFPAVALRGACRLAPLHIEPASDPFTKTLEARWTKSIVGREGGEAIACEVVFPAGLGLATSPGVVVQSHQPSLRCGDLRVKATNLHIARYAESNQKALSEKLLKALSDELCPE